MKLVIENLKVKGYTFTGHIFAADLSAEELKRLEVDTTQFEWGDQPIDVEGEFHVEWDDDIPMVYVDAVYAQAPNDPSSNFYIVLDEDRVDYDALSQEIESHDNGDWQADRIASAMDYDSDMER